MTFDKPLDKWIDEPVDVAVIEPEFDKKGNLKRLKHGKRTATQKTIYTEAREHKIDCGKFNHFWFIPDPHNHTAHCKNCRKRRFIRAVFEQVLDGKLIYRDTKEEIE